MDPVNLQNKGNMIDMATMPFGWRHLRIVLVASLGQFIGQGLATLVGIVIPLMQITLHPELSASMQGLLGCISLIGIMVGSVVFGRLSDRYGYLLFFRLCPAIILIASGLLIFVHSVSVMLVALFVMGFAIGGEYSLDPDYISELMPEKWKLYMVGVAKALASAGSAVFAIICFFLIRGWKDAAPWPWLFAIMAGTALLMLLTRMKFAQSPAWLLSKNDRAAAETAVQKFLGRNVSLPPAVPAAASPAPESEPMGKFVKRNFMKIVLTGVPWACEGLGVYGIGIFLPILIMSFGLDSLPANATAMQHITNSVQLTFVLSIVMMVGFGLGIVLLGKFNHLSMQTWGFWGSAIGLGILMCAYELHWPAWIAIGGFVAFELFLNVGPHLITFILPTRVYAVADRGTGSGIAACIGKVGAVVGAFIIPVLLRYGGATTVLIVSISVMAAGAVITAASGKALGDDSKWL